jgi:hypothetical protein
MAPRPKIRTNLIIDNNEAKRSPIVAQQAV